MEEKHTCECCGVSDDNLRQYRMRDEYYDEFCGVKYYTHDLPPTLDPGWYCNICIRREKGSFWQRERNSYIYDNYGNTADSDDFDWD